jgi:hypothetical protein
MATLTTKDIVARLNCDRATVRRLAKKHGIGRKFGRDWAFTAADRHRLSRILQPVGNPTFRRKLP